MIGLSRFEETLMQMQGTGEDVRKGRSIGLRDVHCWTYVETQEGGGG
jgi:hypothetical protein